jgi:hypothetical protein
MKSPIFLFSSGRCGSTLLQRALNMHPSVVMYGEHEGFLAPLSNSYFRLTQTPDIERYIFSDKAIPAALLHGELGDMQADICWVNSFTRESVDANYRQFLLSLLAGDLDVEEVHWGFKEIRYLEGHRLIWMLRTLFPDSRFIFLFRNPAHTIASSLSAWENPGEILADEQQFRKAVWQRFMRWASKYRYLLEHEEDLGENLYLLRYEDLIGDPAKHMEHIFGMLGLDTPPRAMDVFSHKVASTEKHEHKALLVERIQGFQRKCIHPELREVCARMGYEHLA